MRLSANGRLGTAVPTSRQVDWSECSTHSMPWVGRVVPNPPLSVERIGTRRWCAALWANGRLGTAVPTSRQTDASPTRPYPARRSREVEAVGGWEHREAARQQGQHAVLPLPSRPFINSVLHSVLNAVINSVLNSALPALPPIIRPSKHGVTPCASSSHFG